MSTAGWATVLGIIATLIGFGIKLFWSLRDKKAQEAERRKREDLDAQEKRKESQQKQREDAEAHQAQDAAAEAWRRSHGG